MFETGKTFTHTVGVAASLLAQMRSDEILTHQLIEFGVCFEEVHGDVEWIGSSLPLSHPLCFTAVGV